MGVVLSIFRRAAKTPERLAATSNGVDISYGEFARRIEGARGYLAALTLPADAIAVVCVFDKLTAWVLRLALASLGHTTLALRFVDQVKDFAPGEIGCVVVSAAEGSGEPRDLPDVRLIVAPEAFDPPDDPSTAPSSGWGDAPEGGHIVLTSGTTGLAKRVLIDPANEAAYLAQRLEGFSLTGNSMVNLADWGLWTSVGYSVALGVWSVGGAVALHAAPLTLDILRDQRLTHAILTPTMLDQILATAPGQRLGRDDLRVYVGGSPMSKALAEIARAELTTQLFNIVASTEAGVWCVTPIRTEEDVSLHRVLPSRTVQIVGPDDRVLPAGHEGDVRVACLPGVDGYLDDPEASAAFFRGGYFYSGDLGVLTADGRLKLQGRVTEIVTGATQKFASGPIEQAIRDRLGAAEVCVFSHPGKDGPEELHIAIQPLVPVNQDELRALGSGYLRLFPHVHFHVVASMPRNERGKVLRDALKRQVLAARA
jgi:fatty-acyl-CoA synthase